MALCTIRVHGGEGKPDVGASRIADGRLWYRRRRRRHQCPPLPYLYSLSAAAATTGAPAACCGCCLWARSSNPADTSRLPAP